MGGQRPFLPAWSPSHLSGLPPSLPSPTSLPTYLAGPSQPRTQVPHLKCILRVSFPPSLCSLRPQGQNNL